MRAWWRRCVVWRLWSNDRAQRHLRSAEVEDARRRASKRESWQCTRCGKRNEDAGVYATCRACRAYMRKWTGAFRGKARAMAPAAGSTGAASDGQDASVLK